MIYCKILNIVICDIQCISFLLEAQMESYIYLTVTHIYLNNLSWPFFLLVTDLLHFCEHFFVGCMPIGFSLLDITYFGWERKPTSRNPLKTKPHNSGSTEKKEKPHKTNKTNP